MGQLLTNLAVFSSLLNAQPGVIPGNEASPGTLDALLRTTSLPNLRNQSRVNRANDLVFPSEQKFTLSAYGAGLQTLVSNNLLNLFGDTKPDVSLPIPTSKSTWGNVTIEDSDLASPKVSPEGIVTLPILKDGKPTTNWKIDGQSAFAITTAGKASGLSVRKDDSSKMLAFSNLAAKGTLESRYFIVSPEMKKFKLKMIGNGDMSATYVALDFSVDGKTSTWSKSAPSTVTVLEDFSANLEKLHSLYPGKEIVAKARIVDGSNNSVIGIGNGLLDTETAEPSISGGLKSTSVISNKYKIEMTDSFVADRPFGNEGVLESNGFSNGFICYSPYFRNNKERSLGRALPFGVKNSEVKLLINSVCTSIYQGAVPYVRGQDVKTVGLRILENVDRILNKNGYDHCPKFLRQWLTAEAICAWVIGEFDDNPALAREPDFKKWWAAIQPEAVLSQSSPKTICSSAANLTKFLSKSLNSEIGIDCHYISGFARDFGTGSVPDGSNHSWVCFDFDGSVQVPADIVSHGDARETRRKWTGKHLGGVVLPLTRESWEAFLSYHWGVVTCEDGKWEKFPIDKSDAFSKLNKSEWTSLPLPLESYLKLLNDCHALPFGLPR